MPMPTMSTAKSPALAALALSLSCIALGAAIGLMTDWLLAAPATASDIADAAVEMLVGGALGLLAGLYLAHDLSVRARWWSALFAVLLAAATAWSLALTAS